MAHKTLKKTVRGWASNGWRMPMLLDGCANNVLGNGEFGEMLGEEVYHTKRDCESEGGAPARKVKITAVLTVTVEEK